MRILKIDNKNILTTTDKTLNIIIRILLICSVILVGCELYILLKLQIKFPFNPLAFNSGRLLLYEGM